jgi:gamma-glutamyl hercynylcysteine S-oxide hydrolase
MCRHLAYLGPPARIAAVLADPPHGLVRQSYAPRRQRYGTVNADGFGVGWYADGDPVPARYRRAGPIWGDESFADLARVTRTRALLAAVRSATDGTAQGEAAAAPYAAGRWLFSHNGRLNDWPAATARLAATLPPAELLALPARTDSALAWALVLHRLRGGEEMPGALARTVADLDAHGVTGRFNFLLTDGVSVAATAAGDTLCYRAAAGQLVVASEPADDEPGWTEVPDRSVLTGQPGGLAVGPLRPAVRDDEGRNPDP